MNLFYVDESPLLAAQYLCNKHCVKMVLETAQLLSTAHRVLDGKQRRVHYTTNTGKKRSKLVYTHPDAGMDEVIYTATHINHPSAIWVRESRDNYLWAFAHFSALLREYTARYGKVHKCQRIGLDYLLSAPPVNIGESAFTAPPQCMPEQYHQDSTVEAYRDYYNYEKASFAVWPEGQTPHWFRTEVANDRDVYRRHGAVS